MKNLSLALMGCSILTLLSFQLPGKEANEQEYLPIDTQLGEADLETELITDFDSESF